MQVVQELSEEDFASRLDFATDVLQRIGEDQPVLRFRRFLPLTRFFQIFGGYAFFSVFFMFSAFFLNYHLPDVILIGLFV